MNTNRRGIDFEGVTFYLKRMKMFLQTVMCLAVGLVAVDTMAAAKTFKVGEFNFAVPEKWDWVETSSPMRKAQLKVVDKKDEAEVIFFHFGPNNGGGTQANVDRWLGQFKEPKDKINSKVDNATVNNRKVTYVQAEGTYLAGLPGGPKTEQPNAMLLGAILESGEGNVFIRMTGPAALVKSSKQGFTQMVEGALKGK